MSSGKLFRMGAACAVLLAATAACATQLRADFSDGAGGWEGLVESDGSGTAIDPTDGAPAPSLHSAYYVNGAVFRTTDPTWLDAFRHAREFAFGLGVKVNHIADDGGEEPRDLVLEIRSHQYTSAEGGYASVWTRLGVIDGKHPKWRRLVTRLGHAHAATMPEGWGGTGAEDAATGQLVLPAGVTFADVMTSADEVLVTTLEPGMFYDPANFDIAIDDVTLRYPSQP